MTSIMTKPTCSSCLGNICLGYYLSSPAWGQESHQFIHKLWKMRRFVDCWLRLFKFQTVTVSTQTKTDGVHTHSCSPTSQGSIGLTDVTELLHICTWHTVYTGAAAVIREVQQISINSDKWVPSEANPHCIDSLQICSLGTHLYFLKKSRSFANF